MKSFLFSSYTYVECKKEDEGYYIYRKKTVSKEQYLGEIYHRKKRINFFESDINNYSYIHSTEYITAYFPVFYPDFLIRYFLKRENIDF